MKNIIERKLHKIDATEQTIGRMATRIATLLRGKNKPTYQPHLDEDDIVEVSNIKFAKFTGKKLNQKLYYRFTGYPGGLRTKKMSDVMKAKPEFVLQRAVREMLPPTRLRPAMMKRLIIK
ncbi:MAG: 50S ribosomal protein L13 [Candidatus Falkowbacteria bacterium]